jgi:hypothetical protein
MTALNRYASRFTVQDEARESAGQTARAPATWFYTLAHAGTPLRELALSEESLRELVETLRARNLPLPAELAAPGARRNRANGALSGVRYIWAFSSLRDALQAARANRRSDYRAYPQPATLREASLDRLYRRFPLSEFPRTTVILFSGAQVCSDPLLSADPAPGSLVAELANATGPDLWDRFTLCGFRQGASLIRVTPADRWVRMAPRALEDAWAAAERALREQSDERDAQPELGDQESAAFRALLCALTGATAEEPTSEPNTLPARRGQQSEYPKRPYSNR